MADQARVKSSHVAPPVDFLGRLPASDRADLAGIAREIRLHRGEPVFRAGDAGRSVYMLHSGRIKISQRSGAGREIILWFCFGGEIFGMAEATRGGGRLVRADACEDSVVWAVPPTGFREFVLTHPQAGLLAMEAFAVRLRDLSETMVNVVSDDVRTRIAKLVRRLGSRYGTRGGGRLQVVISLTHQELADMVGTTRQSVTSTLNELRREGLLEVDRHRIVIASESGLEALAG